MNKNIFIFLLSTVLFFITSCNEKTVLSTSAHKDTTSTYDFKYFGNGHLTKEEYKYKAVIKDNRNSGEIVRASDATVWSGMYAYLPSPLYLSDGKTFTIDVWMDHIGSFTLKLEESNDGGSNTAISTQNTKTNQWETLSFDFSNVILDGPSFTKIAIFMDLNSKATGTDVISYFSNLNQIPATEKVEIIGNKEDAITIVVLGSSTAAGTGPKDNKNAWVNRYRRKIKSINGYNKVINLAVGGYTTYQLLPSEIIVPKNRPQPNPKHNVTKALSFDPDAILINLPSNDVNLGHSVKEQLDNYKTICQPFYDKGIPVWVSTTQGRNMSKEKRDIQIIVKDSTILQFGRKTLDFWRGFANWDGTINPKYDSGDGVHINDEAHRLLFEEVWNKDIINVVKDKKSGVIGKDVAYTTSLFREGYFLEWQDEFDGDQLNNQVWQHELGNGCPKLCNWGNNEKVWYRKENTTVKDGKLIITAKQDKEHENYWSASRIITKGNVEFGLGRLDIRAKLPETKGLWPAIWLLGTNIPNVGWPSCGEIDIMEEVGHIPYRVRGTLHYKNIDGNHKYKGDKYDLKFNNFSDDFHVYSIDWDEQSIKFYVDDQFYSERSYRNLNLDAANNPFLKPFYMILNLAVGGNLPGNPDDSSIFPQTFEVDYIRYYKENKTYYNPKTEKKVMNKVKKENIWIYLMAGQSNMEGQGIVGPNDTLVNTRLITLNKEGKWIYAKEPLHGIYNDHKGMSCGYSFAEDMLASVPDSITIALIPCALGGSSIDHWLKDTEFRGMNLWSNMKSKIDICLPYGTFKGLIWHQGESDANLQSIPTYKENLNLLFDKIKTAVKTPELKIVTGELGLFNTNRPRWKEINTILHDISRDSDKISTIVTSDLKDNGDQVHFDTKSLRIMGKRYATKMLAIQGIIKKQ